VTRFAVVDVDDLTSLVNTLVASLDHLLTTGHFVLALPVRSLDARQQH
jgi:hypothetical protein